MIEAAAIDVRGLRMEYPAQRPLSALFRRNAPSGIVTALEDVTFGVAEGEVLGLLGRNGAGKTTLINILCTLLTPTAGRVLVGGHDLRRAPHEARKLVGLVTSNERSFYWRLSGRQNLRFFGDLYHVPARDLDARIEEFLDALDLAGYADRRFDSYSTGVRQRFAFARALLHKPGILFMDEPTKGLDPNASAALLQLVRERISKMWRPTIIVTSHNLSEIEALCDRVAIMDHGRLLRIGTIADLAHGVRSYEAYAVQLARPDRAVILALKALLGAHRVRERARDVLELHLDGEATLSRALKLVLDRGGEIRRCEPLDVSLADVFRVTVQRKDAA